MTVLVNKRHHLVFFILATEISTLISQGFFTTLRLNSRNTRQPRLFPGVFQAVVKGGEDLEVRDNAEGTIWLRGCAQCDSFSKPEF